MVNPFPLDRGRGGWVGAHHNPMEPFPRSRSGLFRQRVPQRAPRSIPDEQFSELFARLPSHRDRALVAFWVSTGARASELLGATVADDDPGQQLITVMRKGTRAMQQLPASPDAFVWLRLYQGQVHGLVPAGPDQPLWWTLRRPFRQLTCHAALRMFTRTGGLRRRVLVRADSGGGTHEFLTWLTARSRRLHYSADMTITEGIQDAIGKVPASPSFRPKLILKLRGRCRIILTCRDGACHVDLITEIAYDLKC